jgi:hypothetical protein
MKQPNTWQGKYEESHSAHNRKAGAARFWKERSNRSNRRRQNKRDVKRADVWDPKYYDNTTLSPMIKYQSHNKERKIHKDFKLSDVIDEEVANQLKQIQ